MTNADGTPFKEGNEVQHKTGGPKMIYLGDDIDRAGNLYLDGGKSEAKRNFFACGTEAVCRAGCLVGANKSSIGARK